MCARGQAHALLVLDNLSEQLPAPRRRLGCNEMTTHGMGLNWPYWQLCRCCSAHL